MRPFVRREAVLSSKIEGTQATLGEFLAAEAGAVVERSPEDLREVGTHSPPTPATSASVPETTTTQAEIVLWKSIENSKNRVDFETYLGQYPKGAFAGLANAHIEDIDRNAENPSTTEGFAVHLSWPEVTVEVGVSLTKTQQFIPGLRITNFRVYEDGADQVIVGFKPESRAYQLVYHPTNVKHDSSYRKVRVELVDDQGQPLRMQDEKHRLLTYEIVAGPGYFAK
jgi:hypothetical protein